MVSDIKIIINQFVMKKLLVVPLFLISIVFFSCEKATVQESQTIIQDEKAVVDPGAVLFGTCDGWYVASFQKERVYMTNEFNSFRITFCPDKTVVIANDIFSVTGNWDMLVDEEIPIKLMINLNTPVEAAIPSAMFTFLNELGGKWDIIQYNRNSLRVNNREAFKEMLIQRGALN